MSSRFVFEISTQSSRDTHHHSCIIISYERMKSSRDIHTATRRDSSRRDYQHMHTHIDI